MAESAGDPPPPVSTMSPRPRDVDELLHLLQLEELDRDLFRARNPEAHNQFGPRLFGGQVAAQAVRAASLTVPDDRWLHSMHGYFLRPGSPERSTILHVDRDRDGRSFSARHVVGRQGGDAVFTMLASFHTDEPGPEFQETPAPEVPAPDDLETAPLWGSSAMFESRPIWPPGGPPRDDPGLSHLFWARTRTPLPDDRLLHACVLTYLSDVGTGFMKHPPDGMPLGGPSLDHAVWFHRPVRMDEWVLVDLEPVVSSGARAYYTGSVYDVDGRLLATITQEYLRRPAPAPGP
jgi:acyl-CoA thioesterase-2